MAVIKEIDNGYKKHFDSLKNLNESKIQIGLFAEVGDKVLTKAIVNEFGTTKAGKNNNVIIPERSFLRSTYNAQYKKVGSRFQKIFESISKKNYDIDSKLKLIATEQVAETKKTITNLKNPPNALSTIARKGSSNPLIDTGEMRSKINYKIKKWV